MLKFIASSSHFKSIEDLKIYIKNSNSKSDELFLAVIDKNNGKHIGNIKYENINKSFGIAVMGILIGDENYRGQGVAQEIITASSKWLKENLSIKKILLGVNKKNLAAINAYEKIGFNSVNSQHLKINSENAISMCWEIK